MIFRCIVCFSLLRLFLSKKNSIPIVGEEGEEAENLEPSGQTFQLNCSIELQIVETFPYKFLLTKRFSN